MITENFISELGILLLVIQFTSVITYLYFTMTQAMRISRFGKVAAALTAATGGSLYIFRDKLKPYTSAKQDRPETKTTEQANKSRLIEDLPEQVPYLLIGGGTASHSAMRAIRGHDPKAKVLIVGSENRNPYMRPMLSKDLWFTDKETRKDLRFGWVKEKDRSIFYEVDEFYMPLNLLNDRENGGVSLLKDIRLTKLDPDKKTAYLENGQKIKYEKCLLAPGGTPKRLPVLELEGIRDKVLYFRTADDFLRLDQISETAKKIVIIGGGFLGSELACALASKNIKDQTIQLIYPESGILAKVLPEYLSKFVSTKVESEGVSLMPDAEINKAKLAEDGKVELTLSNGSIVRADHIVCAVGLEPDIELAKSSGLEVDERTGGYLVNSELEARTNVWVAGDASCFYDRKLGRRRVEHHDHAINSGKLAGENMTGAGKAYTHQSMFWSEIGKDIAFEAVGIIDSSLPTVSVFPEESEKYSKGVVFYLKDDIIVGILLWNLYSRLTIARRLLNEQMKYDDLNEVAKMFNLYLDDLDTI